ncbi:hypothetical protein PVAP13_1NG274819 [Panicum virgatum]|uniref:Uncharacterized protein n=1 Tax=Panicum virgatum TaxID=38727 RepID=A0A8T0X6R7_PANVG|nr:hypothetical protein PVAP13_1NG274819 [Panicum virgatum]
MRAISLRGRKGRQASAFAPDGDAAVTSERDGSRVSSPTNHQLECSTTWLADRHGADEDGGCTATSSQFARLSVSESYAFPYPGRRPRGPLGLLPAQKFW